MGRRICALVVLVVVGSMLAPAPARADGDGSWVRPVDGAVARPFDPPRTRFGAGHLGADLLAAPGTPVRAAGPGVVTFAGSVAGARHVVIAHAGNLRTSYSFLVSVRVRRGEMVAAGDVVGTTGGTGEGHDGSVLHLGLRSGDTYVDPMALFRPIDLTEIVHLAPTTDPPRPQPSTDERRGLLAGLAHSAAAAAAGAGRLVVGAAAAAERALASHLPTPIAALAGTVAAYARHRTCDSHAPPANGEGGSGHRVMLVAGIDSAQSADQVALPLPTASLGYDAREVSTFSYSGRRDYTVADTEHPIMVAARRLADQLRALQRREPGREVDLLAHSQGGVVVEAFLALIYKRDDSSFPPLGTVVTLSSPLRGAPLATAFARSAQTLAGAEAAAAAQAGADAVGVRLPLQSRALFDLASGSALMKRLDAAHLPDMIDVTTIGAATDVIVPANAARLPGAPGTTVIPHGLNGHTAIVSDPAAMQAVRAALEQRPLPCQSLLKSVIANVVPITISALEDRVGRLAQSLGRAAQGG